MIRGETGRYETTIVVDETVRAFVPAPLPPTPALDLIALQAPLEKALLALGRLDSLSVLLPDAHLFLYTYVRKEAVLSSQIEGTPVLAIGSSVVRTRGGARHTPR